MKPVDFTFLEAIQAAKRDGFHSVAAKLPNKRWWVISIDELLRLQGWPVSVPGMVSPGTVHQVQPAGTIAKGKLVEYYKLHKRGFNP